MCFRPDRFAFEKYNVIHIEDINLHRNSSLSSSCIWVNLCGLNTALFLVPRTSLPALLHSPYSKYFHQLFYLDLSSLSIIMEVAGTIIGALSLGITLCDGIVTYCHAWKDQDNEIRSLTTLCETSKQL